MALDNAALTFALALAAGIVGQSLAWHLRIPGIVLLLALGVLLGPDVANLIRPETLGHGLDEIVGLAVAVVLFEGGLNLQWRRLRSEAAMIRRLITIGGAITAAGGALATMLLMGWDWGAAIVFGAIVSVTGPTVITPLLRRIRITKGLRTILEAEAVLIDPIGAVSAVVLLEFVLASSASGAAVSLLGFPLRLAAGAALGIGVGLALGMVLRDERWVPEGQESVFTLAMVLALFEVSNALYDESGITAAAVAGLVVGNMRTRVQAELREFKEQLTVLLVGLLFILLAADIRIVEVVALGWPGVLTLLVLMLIVRPANVWVSATRSRLKTRERLFLSWIAPRGIVAAAIASLFGRRLAETGIAGGEQLLPLTFLVIAATVVLQGGTAGVVASALGVRRPRSGWIVLGANALGRATAWALERRGDAAVLIDRNAPEIDAAQRAGHRVIYGDASQDRTLLQAEAESRLGVVALTPNDSLNLLLARRIVEKTHVPMSWVGLDARKATVTPDQVRDAGSRVLFGDEIDFEDWTHRLIHRSACVERWRAGAGDGDPADAYRGAAFAVAVERGRDVFPADDRTKIRDGDIVAIVLAVSDESLRSRMRGAGWRPVDEGERYLCDR